METTVWIWLPDTLAPVAAGEFRWERGQGVFEYAQAYLDTRGALPLDPLNLPFRRRPLREIRFGGIFGIFLDAGPDSWGRQLLARALQRQLDDLEAIVAAPGDSVGALALGSQDDVARKMAWNAHRLEELGRVERDWAFIEGEVPAGAQEIADFVFTSTALGGTKPKITVEHDGHLWLAKRPERGDSPDLPEIEHAMLQMAGQCGIDAAASRLANLPSGRKLLLVRRFDRVAVDGGYARLAYASAATAMNFDTDARNRGQPSYQQLAQELGRWTGDAADRGGLSQKRELWRRMVFNRLVCNIDDHSRNHGLLQEGGRWKLAPAFDLVAAGSMNPQARLTGSMNISADARIGAEVSIEAILRVSAAFGYEADEAKRALREMAQYVCSEWEAMLRQAGVADVRMPFWATAFRFARQVVKEVKI